jgi:hypothetical protein
LAIKKSLEKLGLFIEKGIAKVKELIAGKITTKQICLEGDDGEKICIDKNQLKELLQQRTNNQQSTSNQATNSEPQTTASSTASTSASSTSSH